MIVLVLVVILAGAAGGTVAVWMTGAPWWQIALGYVGGGWAGLLVGLPALLAVRRIGCAPRGVRRRSRQARKGRARDSGG